MDQQRSPDDILKDLGGCGRYQIRLVVAVHLIKTMVCFSVGSLMIASQVPDWYCNDISHTNEGSQNYHNNSNHRGKLCSTVNGTKCDQFSFDEKINKASIIGEFSLVCDRAYIPSLMMSLQTTGALVGNIFAGQLSDLFGRKKPFFSSFIILIFANFLGFAINNWVVFLVSNIFIGLGTGFFLSTQYSLLSEFTLSKWRPLVIGFPSWNLQMCLFSLVAWLIGDWKNIMLMCACMGVPYLFSWWLIPESFRWYIVHDRTDDAVKVIDKIAQLNNHSNTFDINNIADSNRNRTEISRGSKKHTFLHMFHTRALINVTLLSALNWFTIGLTTNGINYGVKDLSGNIYFNTFLINITSVPAKTVVVWLQNRFGRIKTAMLCYIITAVGGIVVGCVQYIDTDMKDTLTNGFTIVASVGMSMTWGPLQTITIELYPTVIRNVAFGSLNVMGQIGGIIGPQLNGYVPGLLYFVCGIMSSLCVFALMGLTETNNANLTDKLTVKQQNDENNAQAAEGINTNENIVR